MLNALVDGIRTPALAGLKGTCPACDNAVIAKCGPIRIPHWAHKANRACEFSRGSETEWHRVWKSKFPCDCQESIRIDPQGERHIADVRLPHGLVIEFQHSHLCPKERVARERFHKNMWWVVDGARLSRDLARFAKATRSFRQLWQGVYVTAFPDDGFPQSWLASDVPVFFDFRGTEGLAPEMISITQSLWCLLPGRPLGRSVVFAVARDTFVGMAQDTVQSTLPRSVLSKAEEILGLERQLEMGRQRAAQMAAHRGQGWRYRRRLPRF